MYDITQKNKIDQQRYCDIISKTIQYNLNEVAAELTSEELKPYIVVSYSSNTTLVFTIKDIEKLKSVNIPHSYMKNEGLDISSIIVFVTDKEMQNERWKNFFLILSLNEHKFKITPVPTKFCNIPQVGIDNNSQSLRVRIHFNAIIELDI